MAKTFRCSIVTPVASVLDEEATYANFPAWDGQQGVMPGRSPLLTRLGIGPLRIDLASGGSKKFLIDGGFAQMSAEGLTLLTDRAVPAESLTAQEAEQEFTDATARIKNDPKNRETAQRDQQRARVKRAMAKAGK